MGEICVVIPLKVLEASLDESADGQRKDIFAVGAFLASGRLWKGIEKKWIARLAQDEIAYFRATDCKSVSGPFHKLIQRHGSVKSARVVAQKIRDDLEAILVESQWIGFGLGIIIPDYKKVLQSVPEAKLFYADDPTVAAYQQMFFEVARSVCTNAPGHLVAYLADQSDYYGKLADAFTAVKLSSPSIGRAMATVAPFDDKQTPSLQVADLLASITKDLFITWLSHGVPATEPTTEKWQNHIDAFGVWDEEHMLRTVRDSVASGLNLLLQPDNGVSRRERRRRKKGISK